MPNKWVEFVKKWSADNNMNYMCAMTTKECKDAYLKEHPKEPKKARAKKAEAVVAPSAPSAPDRTAVQKELVDMGKKAMEVADKRANIQMELSEMGKKAKLKEAQKEAQDYLVSKVPKKVIIRKKKTPKADAPNTDVARFQEAEANPALKVLTNSDLLKMIGSFTKGMKPSAKVMIEKASAMKGVRGKLRDALIGFFTKIYSNPTYLGDEDEVDFGSGKLKLDDIMAMIYAITLQTSKYSQKDLGNTIIELYPKYKKKYSLDHLMGLASRMFNKGMVVIDIDQIDKNGRHYDVKEKIDTPSTIKDSKYKYDSFRADPNA